MGMPGQRRPQSGEAVAEAKAEAEVGCEALRVEVSEQVEEREGEEEEVLEDWIAEPGAAHLLM